MKILEYAAVVISLFAVVLIIVGFVLAWVKYILRSRTVTLQQNFKEFKVRFGSALTLGLEILVLADVIETISVKVTLKSLVLLALIVIIRTVVSWTLTLEIEGHWPWQSSQEEESRV